VDKKVRLKPNIFVFTPLYPFAHLLLFISSSPKNNATILIYGLRELELG
jgi:hypothetical protein